MTDGGENETGNQAAVIAQQPDGLPAVAADENASGVLPSSDTNELLVGSERNGKKAGKKERTVEKPEKMDDFYQLGRYTYIVCALAELIILCQAGNMLFMMFAGAAPTPSSCGRHSFRAEETSIEFGYYCAGAKVVKTTISYQMVGVILGASMFGYLSDMFGRRRVMTLGLVPCICCMLISSFTTDLFWFTIWRFLVNVFNGGTMVIIAVFTTEHYPKKHRFFITNIIWWSPNFVIFGVIAYLTGEWRMLTRVSAVLALPCLGILFYLNESAMWLVQKGRFDEAKAVILRMYRIDGRKIDDADVEAVIQRERDRVNNSKQKGKSYNYLHLFYTWTFARYTIAVAYSFLIASLINYSLLFNMEKLSGSIYMNTILMGLFRYSMCLAIAFLDRRFKSVGRKFAHAVADSLSALSLAVYVVVYLLGMHESLSFIQRAAVLGTIGFCSLFYTTNGLVANELFPTGVRNLSYSFGQVWTRIGVVLAPQIFFLADLWTPLPHLALSLMAVVDLVLFHFSVVETKGRPLQEHFPDREQRILYRADKKAVELQPLDAAEKGEAGIAENENAAANNAGEETMQDAQPKA